MLKPLSRGFRWALTPEIVRYDSTDSTYTYVLVHRSHKYCQKTIKRFFFEIFEINFQMDFLDESNHRSPNRSICDCTRSVSC